jgi:hypothetical protein
MFDTLGTILKYSLLTLVIIVLSHIVEIRGVSISNHVHRAMNSITSFSPTREVSKISRSMSSSITSIKASTSRAPEPVDMPEVTRQDQRELDQVIQKAERK